MSEVADSSRMEEDVATDLDLLKPVFHVESKNEVVRSLLNMHRTRAVRMSGPATFERMMKSELTTIVIHGPPSSGKSKTLSGFLYKCMKSGLPFLLIDRHADSSYDWITDTIGMEDVTHLDSAPKYCRFVLPLEPRIRRDYLKLLFEDWTMFRESNLQDRIIAVDNADEFKDLQEFTSFVSDSRRYCSICVLVSYNGNLWSHIGEVMEPAKEGTFETPLNQGVIGTKCFKCGFKSSEIFEDCPRCLQEQPAKLTVVKCGSCGFETLENVDQCPRRTCKGQHLVKVIRNLHE